MFQLVKLMCISFGLLLLVSCGGVGVLDLESEGEETDLANIAIGRIVTQSSDAHGAPASLAVDGRTDGTFGNGSVTHTTDEAQPWLQLDLGSVANISEITLFNRTDCCTERLSDFHVLVSESAFESTDLDNTLAQDGVNSYHYASEVGESATFDIDTTGRYIRVQLVGDNNVLSLAEIEVMSGDDLPEPFNPDPELVALYALGEQVYKEDCEACHGPLETTLKRERTLEEYANSLVDVRQMRGIDLTDDELEALTYALNNTDPSVEDPAPVEITGAGIFANQCASCHNEEIAEQYIPLFVDYTTLEDITHSTETTMPFGTPDACVGECATKVSEYIVNVLLPLELESEVAVTQRLKRDHYYKTLDYLLKDFDVTTSALSHPQDPLLNGFANGSTVDSSLVFSYHSNAIIMAKALIEEIEQNPSLVNCGDSLENDCVKDFYLDFAESAYRRPLLDEQIDRLNQIYDATSSSPAIGLGNMFGFILQSPSFLYYIDPINEDNDYSLANELSYLLWNEPPDEELLSLAEQNELRDSEVFNDQIDRLMSDQKGLDTLSGFIGEWLTLSRVQSIVKDTTATPGFSGDVLNDLEDDLYAFIGETIEKDKSIEELFTGSYDLSNNLVDTLSEWSNNIQASRQGILSQPGVLAFLAGPTERSPILRGAYVEDKLLCDHRTPPVLDDVLEEIEIPDDAGIRERTELLTAAPVCMSCHGTINTIGFGFENYDGLGLPISENQNESLVLEGNSGDSDITLNFNGVESFQESLLTSHRLHDCVSEKALSYANIFVQASNEQEILIRDNLRNTASFKELFKSIALTLLDNQ